MRFLRLNCFLLVSLIIVLCASAHAQDIQMLGSIQVDGVDSLALAPNTGIAYGINKEEKRLYIFDLKNYTVKKSVKLDKYPRSIAVNSSNNLAYVTAEGHGKNGLLYVIDNSGAIINKINIPRDPEGIAVNPNNKTIVISIEKGKKLSIFSTETFALLKEIHLPHRPELISIDIESNKAVVVADKAGWFEKHDRLLIIDLNTNEILKDIRLKADIDSIAVDINKDIAVAVSSNKIMLLDINTGNILSMVHTDDTKAVDINQSTHNAVVTEKDGFLLLDLDANTMADYDLNNKHNHHNNHNNELKLKSVAIDMFRNTALFGGKHKVIEIQLPNPKPVITNLVPVSARAGESGFPLKVEGSKFITTSSVQFNYNNVTTTFKNNNEIEAFIPATLLAAPGLVPVTVTNPQPDGGISDPFMFTIKYPVPVLESIVPDTIAARSPDFILKAFGLHFMAGYVVNFNGQDLATTYINPTELNAQVPSSLISTKGTYPVTVISTDRQNSNILNLTVTDPNPVITDFNPKQGLAGTVVTISGDNFNYAPTKIYFNGMQASIQSISQSASGGEIKTVVPVGATTGPIKVTTQIGSFETAESFKVLTRQDFELNISPLSISIPSYGNASAIVQIQSSGLEQFSGLVKLSAVNLPSGITAKFNNEYISSTSYSTLMLNLSSGISEPAQMTITGTANMEGREITKTVLLTLNPIPQGSTALYGQVLASKDAKPIKGVTIKIGDKTAVTDEAGNFTIIDPPVGEQVLMIDGDTANTVSASYPSALPVPVTIIGGESNTLPYAIYLHEVNTKTFTVIDSSKDTIVTDPAISDFQMVIPAGTVIMGWDGKPNEKVSVTTLSPDRIPVNPLPEGVYARTVFMYYFFKSGGGLPSTPVPVTMPNDAGGLPGERVLLWYYDESAEPNPDSNQWKPFGNGTVSEDGKTVIPDPGVGIPKFCCGASVYGRTGLNSPTSSKDPCSKIGDPVDSGTGYFLYEKVDYYVPGVIPVEIKRYYRSGDTSYGGYGVGTYFSYDWAVRETGTIIDLLKPGNYQYRFYKQADGTFKNTADPEYKGAVITRETSFYYLTTKNGWRYRFRVFDGLLDEIRDPNNNTLVFERMVEGNVTKITTPEGKVIQFDIIILGRDNLTKIKGPAGEVTFTYTPMGFTGQLKSVQYPDGSTISYEYDSSGRMTKVIDAKGNAVVTNEYDASHRVIKQTQADGGVYTYNYTVAGGFVTETKMTEPNNNVSIYRFNNAGYIAEKTDAYGQKTVYEKANGTNELISVTDLLGRKTSYTYDSNGNTTSVTNPAGNVTSYEYDLTLNKPVKITDALGNVTRLTYDSKGNLIQILTPKSELITISYNSKGRPTQVTDTLGNITTYTYDSTLLNLIKITNLIGNSVKMEYDALGRMTSSTDAKNNFTFYSYNPMSRITEITDASNKKTKFTYDVNGNLLVITDAKNQTTTYTYDAMDKVASMTDQLGKVETYTYDKNNNLISVTDRKGQITTLTYDLMNRITKTNYADGSSTAYVYDAVGRLTSINDSISGAIEYFYANDGCSTCGGAVYKVIQETTSLGSISYTYDAIGRRTSMTVAGQPVVNYSYDTSSQMTGISTVNPVLGSLNFGIVHDALGRRTSLSLPNGITTNYTYDNTSNLLTLNHLNPLSQILESLNYSYDANGNKTSMNRLNVASKLPAPASNITYNSVNQMLTLNDKTIVYDNNGNMTSITNSCGTTNYTWDARNHLIGINGFNSDCSVLTASFKYDALGRRIEKTINSKTIQYLYDRFDIVQEIEGGTVTANYIRTLNIDEPLARIKYDGTVRYYQQDALGSVIALTDETGAIKTQYIYDPYGNVTISGETSDNPFQYTGRENDGTGLYYYRIRYYSSELQRFISEDPIGLIGGINKFIYTSNNPVNRKDPLGLLDFSWGFGGTLGIFDISWSSANPTQTNLNFATPQIGAGFNFCLSKSKEPIKKPMKENKKCKEVKNSEPPLPLGLEEQPLGYSVGYKNMGISFTDDFESICLNIGLAGGPLPINVTLPLSPYSHE